MICKEYRRIVNNADTAVLFIQGILGTPDHFKEFIPLIPENFSIHNIVLDGHGKGIMDFAHTSMRIWETQTEAVFTALAETHRNIILVGHSMGTLLSIDLAVKYPHKVSALFLLNVPLTPMVAPASIRHSYRVLFDKVRKDRPDEVAAKEAYGIQVDRRLWLYPLWIPRFLELFAKAHKAQKILPIINIPVTAYQSKQDELVSKRSEKILLKHPNITTKSLSHSSHYLYADTDKELLTSDFTELCNKFI